MLPTDGKPKAKDSMTEASPPTGKRRRQHPPRQISRHKHEEIQVKRPTFTHELSDRRKATGASDSIAAGKSCTRRLQFEKWSARCQGTAKTFTRNAIARTASASAKLASALPTRTTATIKLSRCQQGLQSQRQYPTAKEAEHDEQGWSSKLPR